MFGCELIVIGLFHSYAALLTNLSLGMTSASQTHMIKMSEPIVTTALMAVMKHMQWNWNILVIILREGVNKNKPDSSLCLEIGSMMKSRSGLTQTHIFLVDIKIKIFLHCCQFRHLYSTYMI